MFKIEQITEAFEKKSEIFTKNVIFSLSLMGAISIIIRLCILPFNIPLTLDAQEYFSYAIDMSILGKFPTGYYFPNNGWPVFLSAFFSIFHFTNVIDYMSLQRVITVVLSTLTIIPVYLLCRKFFEKKIALLSTLLFAFEPKIILNSTLGITEPLFIFLGTWSIVFFLSNNKKLIYLSFMTLGLFTLVRYEGFLLVFPFTVMFFIRLRKDRKVIPRYIIMISIFIITILPMSYVRSETIGSDGIISHVSAGPSYYKHVSENSIKSPEEIIFDLIITGITNLIKYVGWSTIPTFLCFLPVGIYFIFKNRNVQNYITISCLFALLLPSFYAYSRNIQETRYLLMIYPILCVISGFTIQKLFTKFKRNNLVFWAIFVLVLTSSILFLELKKIDYEHEQEAYDIAKEVVKKTKVINHSYAKELSIPETKYFRIANLALLPKFPVLNAEIPQIQFIETKDFQNIEEYLKSGEKNGLKYLVIDDSPRQVKFLKDVFINEKKYKYLHKEFDSHDHGYKYHVKIFEIRYDELDRH